MRRAVVDAVIDGVAPDVVFTSVLRFDRYPELAPHVRTTTVHRTWPDPRGSSSWELRFRSGLLRWTESEHFHAADLRIEFAQEEGDFDEFAGHWQLHAADDGTVLHFEVDFDFGIPSLEGILDPIAERVIRETVAWSVVGMFDTVRVEGVAPTAQATDGFTER